MAEYYAVERSPECLAHYGVRGMKWGVRRALSKKGDKRAKALHKQYNKANDYLVKLNDKANIGKQKLEYKDRMSLAGSTAIGGAGLIGGSLGLRAFARKNNSRAVMAGRVGLLPVVYDTETGPKVAVPLGAGLAAYSLYNTGKAISAINRTTPKGHSKAVAKKSAFEKEMKKTFKNTPYSDPSYWAKADYKLNKKSYDRARKKRKKVNYSQKYD